MAIIGVAVMLLIVLLTMCSCATKKVVEERVYVHDTVTVHKSDTVVDVKVVHHTDTVRGHESHIYTINNVGDTVKEYHYFHEKETSNTVDSTYRYQAERDSLKQALVEEKQKKKEIKKYYYPKWFWIIISGNILLFILFLRRITLILLQKKKNE